MDWGAQCCGRAGKGHLMMVVEPFVKSSNTLAVSILQVYRKVVLETLGSWGQVGGGSEIAVGEKSVGCYFLLFVYYFVPSAVVGSEGLVHRTLRGTGITHVHEQKRSLTVGSMCCRGVKRV